MLQGQNTWHPQFRGGVVYLTHRLRLFSLWWTGASAEMSCRNAWWGKGAHYLWAGKQNTGREPQEIYTPEAQ